MTLTCKHARLARSCSECESEMEIARLTAENTALRELVQSVRMWLRCGGRAVTCACQDGIADALEAVDACEPGEEENPQTP